MSSRPLKLRKRADLRLEAQQYQGATYWAVKDPFALNYFHLRDEELFVLNQLDGKSSVEEIRDRFNERFAPQFISADQALTFTSHLHRQGLVLADQPDQASVLRRRQRRGWRDGLLQALANPLAIRLPGVDVSPLIGLVYPIMRWAFRPAGVVLAMVVVVAAAVLLLSHSSEVVARLPQLSDSLRGPNLVLLMISLFAIKLLHELGHATACRHYGGECREMGIMLLVLTPCLYCNVSDAWMLPGKWQRMIVSAAGIYVELILAAVAGILWYLSQPGLANTFFLNTLLICTAGTVLLNGNPLLRYDGYFVLADWVEIPNLGGEAQRAMAAPWEAWLSLPGEAPTRSRFGPPWFLLGYGWLSFIYRLGVVAVICWSVYQLLKAYQLGFLAVWLAGTAAAGMTAPLWMRVWRLFRHSEQMRLQPRRTRCALGVGAAALLAGLLWPLPASVRAPVLFESGEARLVVAGSSGRCVWSRAYGDRVRAGELLARLEDPILERALVSLAGRVAELQQQLINRRHQAHYDDRFLGQLPTTAAELRSVEDQWAALRQSAEQLEIRAPCDGVLLPPPVVSGGSPQDEQLTFWTGTPLQTENASLFIRRGQALGVVGEPARVEARAIVDQQQIERIRLGAAARLLPVQAGGGLRRGRVTEISQAPVALVPPTVALLSGMALQEETLVPTTPYYHVRLSLEGSVDSLRHGAAGWARLAAEPETLVARAVRVLRTVFHFHL